MSRNWQPDALHIRLVSPKQASMTFTCGDPLLYRRFDKAVREFVDAELQRLSDTSPRVRKDLLPEILSGATLLELEAMEDEIDELKDALDACVEMMSGVSLAEQISSDPGFVQAFQAAIDNAQKLLIESPLLAEAMKRLSNEEVKP